MQSITILVGLLFLFVFPNNTKCLQNCLVSEVGVSKNDVLKENLDLEQTLYKLDEFVDVNNENDSLGMEEIYEILEQIKTYDSDESELSQYAKSSVTEIVSIVFEETYKLYV